MPTKHCAFVNCTSDSRYKRDGVKFVPFIKPKIDKKKCLQWIHLSRRADLTVDKIKRHTYVCSKHFIDSNGPTIENPNPLPATASKIPRSRNRQQRCIEKDSRTGENKRQQLNCCTATDESLTGKIIGLNAVGNNETNRKCYDMTANPVLDPTETAKIENQHVPIEMIQCNIKTEVEVDEDIFTTAGVNIKQEENWENMDTNCLEPWKVSGTSGDRKRSEIVQIIKDEPGWESNMDSALVDPLQIDEIHESDAIVKFEKVALPQLEAVPTPKIN